MSQAPVGTDLLQPLKILAQFVVQQVGHHLRGFAVLDVLLSVEEPVGDLVLSGVLHDRHDLVDLLLGQFAGPLVQVNVGLETSSNEYSKVLI